MIRRNRAALCVWRILRKFVALNDMEQNDKSKDKARSRRRPWLWVVIPMAVLVGMAIVSGDVLLAVVLAILVCFVMYVPRRVVSFDEFFNIVTKGNYVKASYKDEFIDNFIDSPYACISIRFWNKLD